MHIRVFVGAGASRCVLPFAIGPLLFLVPGCTPNRPDPQTEAIAARAVGLSEDLAFRAEGGPLDEPATIGVLTLADAVRLAATTDPALQAALAQVRVALADADQARLLPNPVLDFALYWGPGKPQIEISLTQDFIRILQIPRRSSAADNRLRQAAADAVTVALDVVAGVQARYVAAQSKEALIPLLLERYGLLGKLVDTAKARLDAKEGTRGDLTTLEAQRVELEVAIAEARRELQEDRLRLSRLIGAPSGEANWKLERWSAPAIATNVEARWIESALAHRPEVQAAAWALSALGDEAALVALLPWEGASLGVASQRDDQSFFTGPAISTPIPIFDMGQAKQARATAEQIEARHNLILAKRKVVEEVRVAFQSLEASTVILQRLQSELVPLQQQRRQQAEDAYKAGQTDVTALFLAEQDLRAAQARVIEVEEQMSISLLHLQRAVGGSGVAASLGAASQSDLSAPTPPRPPSNTTAPLAQSRND